MNKDAVLNSPTGQKAERSKDCGFYFVSCFTTIVMLTALFMGCASRHYQTTTQARSIQKITVSRVPFEKQFTMKEGDANEFRLPSGKIVAVWCERPSDKIGIAAEQTTASGLKTAWGERAYRQPELI
ncbi:MAG TPA: hypothetical protein VN761_03635, partial [Candidatus Polarisedimenticolia bacterium]|nr:hypothetical protein [Candidatus Polarisedimenticolia bacterium]